MSISKLPTAGYPLSQPVVLNSTGSTLGVAYSSEFIGGYQEVATLAERDAIPVNVDSNGIPYINDDLFSSGRRSDMYVWFRMIYL